MIEQYKQRLLLRLLTLGVLILCLGLLSPNGISTPSVHTKEPASLAGQTQTPIRTVQAQTDTPLLISSPRILAWNDHDGEFAFELLNVSSKSIRAYAIKQGVEAGDAQASSMLFINLDLTNSPLLQPNQSVTNFDTCQAASGKEPHLVLSVDYVEFSDGTKWGADSVKFAERSAGQRAAASIISKRLLKILNAGNPNEVINAIEAGATNLEPPPGRSEEWKEGFRNGSNAIATYLKNAKNNDSNQFGRRIRQLAERFKGVD